MDRYDERIIKTDNFKALTTYQNDYKKYSTYKKEYVDNQRDQQEVPTKPPPPAVYEDHETFAAFKPDHKIPFDLLLLPKPITGTNPHVPFRQLDPLPTDEEEAIKNRPRLYMTPACSMDDVPDKEMRKMLINRMYTTEWRAAEREGASNFQPHKPSFHNIGAGDKVKLEIDLQKPLEEKFRLLGKQWEDVQLRGDCDPDEDFWINKDPPVSCGACVDPLRHIVPEETKNIISYLIANDKLRLPNDKPCPSYAGYKPRLPKGVPLAKADLPTVHPFLSTSQAITARYAQDLKK